MMMVVMMLMMSCSRCIMCMAMHIDRALSLCVYMVTYMCMSNYLTHLQTRSMMRNRLKQFSKRAYLHSLDSMLIMAAHSALLAGKCIPSQSY